MADETEEERRRREEDFQSVLLHQRGNAGPNLSPQESSDRAFNARLSNRSAFGNADPNEPNEPDAGGGDWSYAPQPQAAPAPSQPSAYGGDWGGYSPQPAAPSQPTAFQQPAQPQPMTPEQHMAEGRMPPGWSLHHVGMNRMEAGPDTPDTRLSDLNYRIQSIQLTQPEQLRAQALQQSMSGVDEAMHRGDLTPEDAGRLKQQIQAQGEQLWARQGSLPEMLAKQKFLQQQKEAAHVQAILSENATERAARVRANTVDMGNGNSIYVGHDGTDTVVRHQPTHAADQAAKETEKHAQLIESLRTRVATERQHYQTRLDAWHGKDPATRGPAPTEPEWMAKGSNGPLSNEENEVLRQLDSHNTLTGRQNPATWRDPRQPAGGSSAGQGGQTPQRGAVPVHEQRQALDQLMRTLLQPGQTPPASPTPAMSQSQIDSAAAEMRRQQANNPGPTARPWWDIFGGR